MTPICLMERRAAPRISFGQRCDVIAAAIGYTVFAAGIIAGFVWFLI